MSHPPAESGAAGAPGHPPIGVLVVDDHAAVRAGVCRLLDDQPDLNVLAQASGALSALDAPTTGIDVAVLDYHLGDRSGLWLARRLLRRPSPPHVVVYSAFTDDALVLAAVLAGADGLLGKSAIGEELCLAVRRVARGQRYLPIISPAVARAMGARVDPRLRPVFSMLAADIEPGRVMAALGISGAELDAARDAILSILAPAISRGRWHSAPSTPLRYDRPRALAARV